MIHALGAPSSYRKESGRRKRGSQTSASYKSVHVGSAPRSAPVLGMIR